MPSPRDLPDPGIEPEFAALQVDSLPAQPPGKTLCIFFFFFFLVCYVQHAGSSFPKQGSDADPLH